MKTKKIFVIFSITAFSVLIAAYLWNKITLPYSNPFEIVGEYSLANYNPTNETIRYVFFLSLPLITFWFTLNYFEGDKIKSIKDVLKCDFEKNDGLKKNSSLISFFYFFLIFL